eukprot:COSAG01_NODE_3015_length_6719_cov_129.305996_9_plen_178_part_00
MRRCCGCVPLRLWLFIFAQLMAGNQGMPKTTPAAAPHPPVATAPNLSAMPPLPVQAPNTTQASLETMSGSELLHLQQRLEVVIASRENGGASAVEGRGAVMLLNRGSSRPRPESMTSSAGVSPSIQPVEGPRQPPDLQLLAAHGHVSSPARSTRQRRTGRTAHNHQDPALHPALLLR